MKIAFSARGPGPSFDLDENFGRAYWHLIYDERTGEWTGLDNSDNRAALDNAGLRAARLILDYGVEAVVSGKVGPRVFRFLHAQGVKVYLAPPREVAELLEIWTRDALPVAVAANSQGSPHCLVAQPLAMSGPRQTGVGAPDSVARKN